MLDISQLVEKGLVVKPDSAKGRLVKAAAKLFKEKGYERTTVRELANEVGILSGSLFHHFPNKEAILFVVIKEAILKVKCTMEYALAQTTDVSQQLRILIRHEGEAILDNSEPGFQLMVPEWRSLSPNNQKPILELRHSYEGLWRQVLERMYEQGLINIEADIMRHIIRGALIETNNWYRPDGMLTSEEIEEKIYMAVVHQR